MALRKHQKQADQVPVDRGAIVTAAWDLYLRVVGALPPSKVGETSARWLGKADDVDDDTFARAMVLAMDLEAFAPSSLDGSTAFSRLARRGMSTPVEAAAFTLIEEARMVVFEITGEDAGGESFSATNLTDGAPLTIFDEGVGPDAIAARAFARLGPLPDGTYCTLGPITPLDDDGLNVAREFLAKGKRSAQDHRCAAAVFKHVIRHGNPKVIGLNFHPEMEAEYADDALSKMEPGPIDLAAKLWDQNGQPSEGELVALRSLASLDAVVEGFFKASALLASDMRGRGEAYLAITELHVRTLQKRFETRVGSLEHPLDRIADAINDEVRLRDYPIGAQALFEAVRDRLLAEAPPKASADDGLAKVIDRIRALRAKTPDQGCTENEALAAAAKVAELLDRYGLTLSAIEIERQVCEGIGIDSTRKRQGPLDECLQPIATFCDCRAWQEKTGAGYLRTIFFGLPADVEAAHFLYERVADAIDTESAAFKTGEIYARTATGDRRRATNSFQIGFAEGIRHKLDALKKQRCRTQKSSGGQDLVPVKTAAVEDGLSKLGLRFTSKEIASRLVEPLAYRIGQVAGRQFQPTSDIEDRS